MVRWRRWCGGWASSAGRAAPFACSTATRLGTCRTRRRNSEQPCHGAELGSTGHEQQRQRGPRPAPGAPSLLWPRVRVDGVGANKDLGRQDDGLLAAVATAALWRPHDEGLGCGRPDNTATRPTHIQPQCHAMAVALETAGAVRGGSAGNVRRDGEGCGGISVLDVTFR